MKTKFYYVPVTEDEFRKFLESRDDEGKRYLEPRDGEDRVYFYNSAEDAATERGDYFQDSLILGVLVGGNSIKEYGKTYIDDNNEIVRLSSETIKKTLESMTEEEYEKYPIDFDDLTDVYTGTSDLSFDIEEPIVIAPAEAWY